jgi:pimeloyl-ACP methyl ester carboxylesterase
LVHGIGMSHRYLDRLASELGTHGDTYSLDLPGFGGTAKPARVLSVEDHARLIGEVLDRIGVRNAVLIGHSMGAQFVTELARQRPELASGLVLLSPVTDPERATALTQARDLARDSLRESPLGNLLTFAAYVRCGPRWYLATLPFMLSYRTDLALSQVSTPTLVLRGENDPVARAGWCSSLAASAPHGELQEIPGKRHLVQFTAADQTAEAILGFLHRSARVEPEVAV